MKIFISINLRRGGAKICTRKKKQKNRDIPKSLPQLERIRLSHVLSGFELFSSIIYETLCYFFQVLTNSYNPFRRVIYSARRASSPSYRRSNLYYTYIEIPKICEYVARINYITRQRRGWWAPYPYGDGVYTYAAKITHCFCPMFHTKTR